MTCSSCRQCPGYVEDRTPAPAVLADGACPECDHPMSAHHDGQARIIAAALSPGGRISSGEPPKDSPLAQLRARVAREAGR